MTYECRRGGEKETIKASTTDPDRVPPKGKKASAPDDTTIIGGLHVSPVEEAEKYGV